MMRRLRPKWVMGMSASLIRSLDVARELRVECRIGYNLRLKFFKELRKWLRCNYTSLGRITDECEPFRKLSS